MDTHWASNTTGVLATQHLSPGSSNNTRKWISLSMRPITELWCAPLWKEMASCATCLNPLFFLFFWHLLPILQNWQTPNCLKWSKWDTWKVLAILPNSIWGNFRSWSSFWTLVIISSRMCCLSTKANKGLHSEDQRGNRKADVARINLYNALLCSRSGVGDPFKYECRKSWLTQLFLSV